MKSSIFNIIFPIIFLLIIILSWVVVTPPFHTGHAYHVDFPKLKVYSLASRAYQKQFENYLRHNFPTLSYWLYLRNDIYEIMNLGLFHTSDNPPILQGKHGVLYEAGYVDFAYDKDKWDNINIQVSKFVGSLAKLSHELNRRGIQFALVMAPNKVALRPEDLPALWLWRMGDKLPHPFSPYYAAYENALRRNHILAANCLQAVINDGSEAISFPDRGTHWSMYAAGICVQDLSRKLHNLNPLLWPQIIVTGRKKTKKTTFFENDLARHLNIYPPYSLGNDFSWAATYAKLSANIPLIIVGDSYVNQFRGALELSGFSQKDSIFQFSNQIPAKEAFLKALDHSRLVLMIFTTPTLGNEISLRVINTLNSYLCPTCEAH